MTTTPTKNNPMLWIIITAAAIVIIASIILVINQGMKQPESSTQDGALEFGEAQGTLVPGEDACVCMENVTVNVPGVLIKAGGNLWITNREPSLQPGTDDPEWIFAQVVNVEYRDAQDTTLTYVEFEQDIEICFGVSDDQWAAFSAAPEDFVVQRYTEDQQKWSPLNTIGHEEDHQICGMTNHLSLFALCIRPGGGEPEPTPTEGGPYEP